MLSFVSREGLSFHKKNDDGGQSNISTMCFILFSIAQLVLLPWTHDVSVIQAISPYKEIPSFTCIC